MWSIYEIIHFWTSVVDSFIHSFIHSSLSKYKLLKKQNFITSFLELNKKWTATHSFFTSTTVLFQLLNVFSMFLSFYTKMWYKVFLTHSEFHPRTVRKKERNGIYKKYTTSFPFIDFFFTLCGVLYWQFMANACFF